MRLETFGPLAEILEALPSSHSAAWDRNARKMYLAGLEDIPDEIVPLLIKAIIKTCRFRPTPAEIISLFQTLRRQEGHTRTAADVVAEIYLLEKRYGSHAKLDAAFLPARVFTRGEPDWTDEIKRRVIGAFGGWVAFCEEDTPYSVRHGQLFKIAQMVLAGADTETMTAIKAQLTHERTAAIAQAQLEVANG